MTTNPESTQLKEIADEIDKVVSQTSSDPGSAAPVVDDTPTTDPLSVLEVRVWWFVMLLTIYWQIIEC